MKKGKKNKNRDADLKATHQNDAPATEGSKEEEAKALKRTARKEYEKTLTKLQEELVYMQEWIRRQGKKWSLFLRAAMQPEKAASSRESRSD